MEVVAWGGGGGVREVMRPGWLVVYIEADMDDLAGGIILLRS